jgi:proteasome lid subunit RPN8/RPN11
MILAEGLQQEITNHAAREYPKECCGLVIVAKGKQRYVACTNTAVGTDQFVIDPEDYAAAEEAGDIVAVIHSHVNIPATPSQADLVSCEASGLPWFILSFPAGQWEELYPNGYKAPYVGRVWSHGVLDCYAIIRDWYANERDLILPEFSRHDEWWLRGENLYEENFDRCGFKQIKRDELRTGDLIFMQIGSPVSNHAAIYLGDGIILHHIQNRLSTRDVYGGYWLKNTTRYLRHEKHFTAG